MVYELASRALSPQSVTQAMIARCAKNFGQRRRTEVGVDKADVAGDAARQHFRGPRAYPAASATGGNRSEDDRAILFTSGSKYFLYQPKCFFAGHLINADISANGN